MKTAIIYSDAAQNTVRKTVNRFGKKVKFDNGGYRIGLLIDNGEKQWEGIFFNTQCPDSFAGECWSILKAVEAANELGLASIEIRNDRIDGFEATRKRNYIGSKYLWIAKKIANENEIEVTFNVVSGDENLADRVSRIEDSKQGIKELSK